MNLVFDLCSFGFMIPCGYNGILFLLLGNFCDYIRSRNLGFFCLAQNYQCRDLKVGASWSCCRNRGIMISQGNFLIGFMIEITDARSEKQRRFILQFFLQNYSWEVVAELPTILIEIIYFLKYLVSFRSHTSLRQLIGWRGTAQFWRTSLIKCRYTTLFGIETDCATWLAPFILF